MTQRYSISRVDDLIRAFGGTFAVAELCDVVPSAVSNWIAQDSIPRGHHLPLYFECKRRGIPLDTLSLFGIADAA